MITINGLPGITLCGLEGQQGSAGISNIIYFTNENNEGNINEDCSINNAFYYDSKLKKYYKGTNDTPLTLIIEPTFNSNELFISNNDKKTLLTNQNVILDNINNNYKNTHKLVISSNDFLSFNKNKCNINYKENLYNINLEKLQIDSLLLKKDEGAKILYDVKNGKYKKLSGHTINNNSFDSDTTIFFNDTFKELLNNEKLEVVIIRVVNSLKIDGGEITNSTNSTYHVVKNFNSIANENSITIKGNIKLGRMFLKVSYIDKNNTLYSTYCEIELTPIKSPR